jgi:hypothetical protein
MNVKSGVLIAVSMKITVLRDEILVTLDITQFGTFQHLPSA